MSQFIDWNLFNPLKYKKENTSFRAKTKSGRACRNTYK